jgi:hypothetical protein
MHCVRRGALEIWLSMEMMEIIRPGEGSQEVSEKLQGDIIYEVYNTV